MAAIEPVVLILCGGSGTRFWPASTAEKPKQYLNLFDAKSLLQGTVTRARQITADKNIFACSLASQTTLLKAQVPALQLILEPSGRNTAACIMLSVAHFLKEGRTIDTPMLVLPSDHHIADEAGFIQLAKNAMAFACKNGGLGTLGIVPTHAHTGYGYIEAGSTIEGPFKKVSRFVEKPDANRAREFLSRGGFFWNAGIFVWTLGAIAEAFAKFLPKDWDRVRTAIGTGELEKVYSTLPSTPIDIAVMEKTDRGFVVPAQIGWSDVGSWSALRDLLDPAPDSNVALGETQKPEIVAMRSHGCLVKTQTVSRVALVGVEGLIVVEDGGQILVCHRDHDQDIKEVARAFTTLTASKSTT